MQLEKWQKGQIAGVIVKKLSKHLDNRGFLCETFRIDELPQGLQPVMSYVSYTEPGGARGPHQHSSQTDIFTFLGPGNFRLRLWDTRENSETRGCFVEIYAGRDNPLTIVVPPGVVHGYKNISAGERGLVINYPDQLYKGWGKAEPVDETRYEDDANSSFSMED